MRSNDPNTAAEGGETVSSSRPLVWWLSLCLLGVLEGAVTGALQGRWAGAVNGGLFGALVGPLFAAWALYVWEKRQKFFWQAVLLGAAIEAAGGLCIGWAARQMPPQAMLAFAVGLLVTVGLPALAVWAYFAGISRERTWALLGGAVGALPGAIFFAGLVFLEGFRKNDVDLLPATVIGFIGGAPVGGLFGSFLAAAVRAQMRLLQRLQLKARCRRNRHLHGGPFREGERYDLDLEDLEQMAAAPPAARQLALLLLEAMRDNVEVLHLESQGEVCRLVRQAQGTSSEMVPVAVPTLDLAREAALRASLPPLRADVWLEGMMQVRFGGLRVGLPLAMLFSPAHTRVSVRFPGPESYREPAARLLREFQAFTGDPWSWPVGEITLRRSEPGTRHGERNRNFEVHPPHSELEGAVVRLEYGGFASAGAIYVPFFVTLDGRPITEGSMAQGFGCQVSVPPGRHLLRAGPQPFWPFRHDRHYLLHVVEPGRYEVHFTWSTFWGNLKKEARVIPL